jgi:hypothetical protein
MVIDEHGTGFIAQIFQKPISQLVNELIEGAEPASVNYRLYLGASSVGAGNLRRFSWTGCATRYSRRA